MIRIKKSPTADTRTCDVTKVTKDVLEGSSLQHIQDVDLALSFFENILRRNSYHASCNGGVWGAYHDHDKLSNLDQFHADFTSEGDFTKKEWYRNHLKVNRHHIDKEGGCPEDVNLCDIIEHICDVVMAGMARSGEVYPVNLSSALLEKAVQNTVEMLKAEVGIHE